MTPTLKQIEDTARAVSSRKWIVGSNDVDVYENSKDFEPVCTAFLPTDAAHIAMMSPQRTLELVADLRAAAEALRDVVLEIGEPDETVIPVWPIETEMAITHPLTVGMVRTFRAALKQTQAAVPDGWQLVPKEPTKEMVKSAIDLYLNRFDITETYDEVSSYKAMLAAAPQPDAQKVGE